MHTPVDAHVDAASDSSLPDLDASIVAATDAALAFDGHCPQGYAANDGATGCMDIDECARAIACELSATGCVLTSCGSAQRPRFAIRATAASASIGVISTGFSVGAGAWTFEFWIRVHDLFQNAESNDSHVFDMNEDYAAYAIRPFLRGRSIVGYTYNDSDGPANLIMTSDGIAAMDSGWHHVAMTYESGTGRLSVDGVQRAVQMNAAPQILATSKLAIGRAAGYRVQHRSHLAWRNSFLPSRSLPERYVLHTCPELGNRLRHHRAVPDQRAAARRFSDRRGRGR